MKKLALIFTIFIAANHFARAQNIYPSFSDRFDCSNQTAFGNDRKFAWESNWLSDPWTTNLDAQGIQPAIKGVAATQNSLTGATFGSPIDAFENVLLTGHTSWNDTSSSVLITNLGTGASGLVLRYQNENSFYVCTLTFLNGAIASCNGGAGVEDVARIAVHRVKTGDSCSISPGSGAFELADLVFSPEVAQTYLLSFAITGNNLVCAVTSGGANPNILQVTDNSPLPPGKAGLLSWASGGNQAAIFDNYSVRCNDLDSDQDGIPDEIEVSLSLNPNSVDTDGDTIVDSHEVGNQSFPYDSDSNGTIDALEEDSDKDGIPDSVEAGDAKLETLPFDVNCNGVADFREVGDIGTPTPTPSPFSETDCDGDGLTNDEELALGTDECLIDTDGDELNDFLEKKLGTNPLIKDVRLQGSGIAAGCVSHLGSPLALLFIVLLTAFFYGRSIYKEFRR